MDEKKDAPSAEPAEQHDQAAKQIHAPKLAFVKGGTGTSASERLYEQRFQEAEERRDEQAAERTQAADARTVRRDDGLGVTKLPGHEGGAVEYTSQMTAHPEVPKAYVLLKYLNRAGSPTGDECLADIIVGANPERPTELCLMLVCPHCQRQSHKHMQDNQLRIFQSNKFFELVPGKGPPLFRFEGQVFRSAGVITESEPFSCPDCGWRARINGNYVRED